MLDNNLKDHDLNFIKTAILAEKINSLFVVCSSSIHFVLKVTKMILFIFLNYIGPPATIPLKPRNPLIIRGFKKMLFAIKLILRGCTNSKIGFSIIQPVSIYMIGMKSLWSIHYKSVKKNLFMIFSSSDVGSHVSTPKTIRPMKWFNFFKILFIDNSFETSLKFDNHNLII